MSHQSIFRMLTIIALSMIFIIDCISYSEQAESVAGKDKLVKSLSGWTYSPNSSRDLNQWQEKAMYKALCKPFQLIQGPPGISSVLCYVHTNEYVHVL